MAKSLLVSVCVVAVLAGCADYQARYANRYGPKPVIAEADIREAAERHTDILGILSAEALGYPAVTPSDWYEVVQYGFNYVDEKCDSYLWNLFILERERGRISKSLVLIDKTTTAILTAADASKATIAIVAEAFGFGQGITDIVASSYLFSIPPSLISKNVKDAQFAYRTDTSRNGSAIKTRGVAYARIRGYLQLCFPQSIEARIEENLAKTTAAPKKPVEEAPAPARARPFYIVPDAADVPPNITTVPLEPGD